MSAPENPPAFPYDETRNDNHCDWTLQHPGMTLRDWFAGQAVGTVLNRLLDVNVKPGEIPSRAASAAYDVADAMLAERAKGGAS